MVSALTGTREHHPQFQIAAAGLANRVLSPAVAWRDSTSNPPQAPGSYTMQSAGGIPLALRLTQQPASPVRAISTPGTSTLIKRRCTAAANSASRLSGYFQQTSAPNQSLHNPSTHFTRPDDTVRRQAFPSCYALQCVFSHSARPPPAAANVLIPTPVARHSDVPTRAPRLGTSCSP